MSCGRSGRRVMRTEWLPCRAYGPTGCRVVRPDRVVTVSRVRTVWLQRSADGVVAASCGPRGRLVMRTDALDTV